MELTLVKGDVEIKGGIDGSSSEIFGNDIGIGREGSVFDRDSVERFQGVDEAKGFTILLENTEPATIVRGGGRFVDTRSPFVLDNLCDVAKDTPWNRTLSVSPGRVRDVRDLDGCEVGGIEGASFFVSLSESGVMSTDDPFGQFDFLW